MTEKVAAEFGGRIRTRVCGLLFKGEDVLLLNHKGIYGHDFWSPPGGGVELGESLETALRREFREECMLDITVKRFLFGCEFIRLPLHAIELFYEVEAGGMPILGADPELGGQDIISELQFIDPQRLRNLPRNHLHGIFQKVESAPELKRLAGFYRLT